MLTKSERSVFVYASLLLLFCWLLATCPWWYTHGYVVLWILFILLYAMFQQGPERESDKEHKCLLECCSAVHRVSLLSGGEVMNFVGRLRQAPASLLSLFCRTRQDISGIRQNVSRLCRVGNFCRRVVQVALRVPADAPVCILTPLSTRHLFTIENWFILFSLF
jgi:hypothetical protein